MHYHRYVANGSADLNVTTSDKYNLTMKHSANWERKGREEGSCVARSPYSHKAQTPS